MLVCWLDQTSRSVACTKASVGGCKLRGYAAGLPVHLGLRCVQVMMPLYLRCWPQCAGDGWEQWQHRFDAPPVAAYASGTGRVNLLAAAQQQRAALTAAAGASAAGYAALLPARRASRADVNSEAVVLVTLNNSLFGIPASHVTFEVPAGSDAGGGSATAEQCEVPLEERLAREQQQQPGGSPGSALAVFQPQHHGKQAQGSQAAAAQQCKPTDAEMCAATTLLGVYAVQHGGSDLMLLPPASNSSAGQGQQDGTAVGRIGVLLLLVSAAMGGAASVVVVVMVAWRRTAAINTAQQQAEQQQQQQQQQTPQSAVAQDVSSSRARRRGSASGKRQQQQMSNRLKGLVQQAASDDATGQQTAAPDAAHHAGSRSVALTSPAQQDEGLPSSAAVAAGLMDPAMRRREMQDGVILIGRMRVRSYGYANAWAPSFSGISELFPLFGSDWSLSRGCGLPCMCLAGRPSRAWLWQWWHGGVLRRARRAASGSEAHAAPVL